MESWPRSHHIGLEANEFSHTVNESASEEHSIAFDEFHCIITDEKAWKYGNNRVQGAPWSSLQSHPGKDIGREVITIDIFAT
jgi:hypothetical protein